MMYGVCSGARSALMLKLIIGTRSVTNACITNRLLSRDRWISAQCMERRWEIS